MVGRVAMRVRDGRWPRRVAWLAIVTSAIAAPLVVRARPDNAAEQGSRDAAEVVYVPVESGRLSARVVTRGNVVMPSPTRIMVAQPPPDADPVLTKVPDQGAAVSEGDVLYELAGRPVFVLAGAIRAYRDLHPGDSGEDVKQLQAALKRLGHYSGQPDGQHGALTSAAVERLYAANGYRPPQPEQEAVNALQELLQQREELTAGTSETDGDAATEPDPGIDRQIATLDTAIAAAREALGTPTYRRELTSIAVLPTVVQTVDHPAGATVEPGSPLVTVSSGEIVVEVAFLDPGFDRFIGRDVELGLGPGIPAGGVVSGKRVDDEGAATLTVSSDLLTTDHLGTNIMVTILDRTAEEESLLVPESAVAASGDGQSHVEKKTPDGARERVDVIMIDTADGTAAVRPRDAGALSADDLVAVTTR